MEKHEKLTLTLLGRDSWSRPVYEAVQPVLDREQVAENHDVVPIVRETVMSQEPRDGSDVVKWKSTRN